MSEIWETVSRRMEQRVGAQNYEIWIKPIRLLGIQGPVAELEVPNRYYLDWVQDNYEGPLAEELSAAARRPLRLQFTLEEPGPAGPEESEAPVDPRRAGGVPVDKTFESYVVGSCNQFAHAAALAVADFPGQNYNPLFIFGGRLDGRRSRTWSRSTSWRSTSTRTSGASRTAARS